MKFLVVVAVLLPACLALPAQDSRIVGGAWARPGQFPHQISILVNNVHGCGGSIISANVILTAAHCVYGIAGQMVVLAGVTNLHENGVRVPVAYHRIHQGYNPNTFLNDIAILKLAGNLPLGGYVQAIRLRNQPVVPGETLTLSGWGRTSYPGELPMDLKWINLAAIDLRTCASKLVGSHPIGNGHVCTSSPVNQGSCQGDSGGPLIDAYNSQIGVVSWGITCAKGFPDVFTSVPAYLDWIYANSQ